ncbi:MAG: radical SAM protein [Deltaproteobacteria bacterium]|nr:radical SAM protein [Deltaproteobacteria bacterium]
MGFLTNYALNYAALRLGREPRRPLFASWFITHRCPLDCVYCSDGEGRPFHAEEAPELSTADGKRLISIIRKSTTVFDITGGEPMVRQDLEELLRHAKSEGLTTLLNTKGIGIAERPEIVDYTDNLILSLESFDVDKTAAIIRRPRETAQKVLQAVEDGLRLTRDRKKKLTVSMVAFPGDVEDIGPILRWCLAHDVVFQIAPKMSGVRPPRELLEDPRWVKAMDEVIAAKRKTDLVIGTLGYLEHIRELRATQCLPLLLVDIRPDGGLYYPCLERKYWKQSILAHGSIEAAQAAARREWGPVPKDCGDQCHLFCHMSLSLSQRSLRVGAGELRSL